VNELGSLLPFVIILLAFYLLVIRPARNRQRDAARLQASLEAGQRVVTTAGLFATVVGVEDDFVLLEAAPGVTTRWSRAAVARVLPTEPVDEPGEVDDTDNSASRSE
jgi:preprotein translocase subunit YajC